VFPGRTVGGIAAWAQLQRAKLLDPSTRCITSIERGEPSRWSANVRTVAASLSGEQSGGTPERNEPCERRIWCASWNSRELKDGGWGYHADADLGYFFTGHLGLGGFARFTRGTVTLGPEDFLLDEELDVKVGGFQGGGGLRIRF